MRLDTPDGGHRALEDGWFVIKPGDPSRSALVERILHDDPDEMMPPPESHLTLSADERRLLVRWIEQGAVYEPHWAFVPVPAAASLVHGVTGNPIDALVRARLARERLAPSPPADRAVLLRRLAFNLTGLPPTPAEIDAFLADTRPGAYERAVDRYLAAPAYGERMAMDWLDLARYADTHGYQADVERDMSPWRDWVIRAFTQNLPYDRFLTWQLAGDLLPNATDEQRLATAFNRLHRQTNEGGSIEEEFRQEYVSDRVHTFGTALLGLTLECARCHDHKFDPITQRDYYALGAFFNSIDESGLISHFTSATPTPAMPLWPAGRREQHAVVQARDRAARVVRWPPSPARRDPASPSGDAPRESRCRRRSCTSISPRRRRRRRPATRTARRRSPIWPRRRRRGCTTIRSRSPSVRASPAPAASSQFNGDNAVVHHGAPTFRRTDPFSIAIRLRPTERQDRAVVLHQSRSWTDAGSRGYEIVLDHGRPTFALTHFWPGNAVAVRATAPLPLDTWSTLVVTYDGSSRAAGLRIYARWLAARHRDAPRSPHPRHRLPQGVGGQQRPAAVDDRRAVPRQRLQERADRRRAGLRRRAHRRRSPRHAAGRAGRRRLRALRRPRGAGAARWPGPQLRQLRRQENALAAGVPEIMVMEELPSPRPAHLLARGAYDAPKELVAARHAAAAAAVPGRRPAQSPRPGPLADRSPPPADRPRRRQPDLADALRPRPGRDAGGLRQPGPAADASRAARLAGGDVHGVRLGRQGAAPPDRDERDVPAVVAGVRRRSRRAIRTTRCSPAVRRSGCSPSRSATAPWPRAACSRAASAAAASSRTSRPACGNRPAPARPTRRTPATSSIAAASTPSGGGRCRRRRCSPSTRCRARSARRGAR